MVLSGTRNILFENPYSFMEEFWPTVDTVRQGEKKLKLSVERNNSALDEHKLAL